MDGQVFGCDGEDGIVWEQGDQWDGGLYGCVTKEYEFKEGDEGAAPVRSSPLDSSIGMIIIINNN